MSAEVEPIPQENGGSENEPPVAKRRKEEDTVPCTAPKMEEKGAVESKTQFEFLRLPSIAQNLIIEQLDFLAYTRLKSCSKAIEIICNSSKEVFREFEVESIDFQPYHGGCFFMGRSTFQWKNGDRMVDTPWLKLKGNKDLGEMRAKELYLNKSDFDDSDDEDEWGYSQRFALDDQCLNELIDNLNSREVTADLLVCTTELSCNGGKLSELIEAIGATSLKCKCLLRLNGIRDGILDEINWLEWDCSHECSCCLPGCIMPPDVLLDLTATTLKFKGVRVHAHALNDFLEQWQQGERAIAVLHVDNAMDVFDEPPEDLLFAGLDAVMVPGPVRPVTEHVSTNDNCEYDEYGFTGVLWLIERPRATLFVHLKDSPDPSLTRLAIRC